MVKDSGTLEVGTSRVDSRRRHRRNHHRGQAARHQFRSRTVRDRFHRLWSRDHAWRDQVAHVHASDDRADGRPEHVESRRSARRMERRRQGPHSRYAPVETLAESNSMNFASGMECPGAVGRAHDSADSPVRRSTLSQALTYNHKGGRACDGTLDFLPHVGNLSRTIVVRRRIPRHARARPLQPARGRRHPLRGVAQHGPHDDAAAR